MHCLCKSCDHAKNPNATIVVAPSDHIILKEDIFTKNVLDAMQAASQNEWLLTLGIEPSRPDTGYGYIQFVDEEVLPELPKLKKVKTFTEKPNLEIAKSFLESGDFLWNSGIFIWSLKSINQAFDQHLPEVNELFAEGKGKYSTADEYTFIKQTYSVCRNISIDYGVMEKAPMFLSCQSILVGATWGHGARCTTSAKKTKKQTPS